MANPKPLFQRDYQPDLQRLLDRPGGDLQVWTFDDTPTRRAAEAAFARRGITARCRSALKPLVCAFRDEIPTLGLRHARILWPDPVADPIVDPIANPIANPIADPQASPVAPGRFLLEAYPLTAMFPGVAFAFAPQDSPGPVPCYGLDLRYDDGTTRQMQVLAPNALGRDPHGRRQLSPCGWLIRDGVSARMPTSYEAILHDALAFAPRHVAQRLTLSVTLPAQDEPLGVGDEALSLTEALHEELYFSLLEQAQARAGLPAGARDVRCGQIVPDVGSGAVIRLAIVAEDWRLDPDTPPNPPAKPIPNPAPNLPPDQPLDQARHALGAAQIARELAQIGGQALDATSVAGRKVGARWLRGADRPMLLTAGQHANEVSGPVGALRAAQLIAARPGANLVLCPLENPDGYALRAELGAANPRHMLHAARYTALGDDLGYRQNGPAAERSIRDQAIALARPALQVSLHGYPAHEWLRPLSGYLPAGFESWSLPRGFFLILRHWPGWGAQARHLGRFVAARLAADPAIAALNARQAGLRRIYAAEAATDDPMPCLIAAAPDQPLPLMLITEYPDETLHGAAFVAAHQAQMLAVLAAYDGLQRLDPGDWPAAALDRPPLPRDADMG